MALKDALQEVFRGTDREQLLFIIGETESRRGLTFQERRCVATMQAVCVEELESRYGCNDCCAPAGKPCRPEYGCGPENRVIEAVTG